MDLPLLDAAAILFGLAALLGLVNHHFLKLPFTIGVTFAALLASIAVLGVDALIPDWGLGRLARGSIAEIDFTYALLHGMLGFLLFAGALHTDLESLRKYAAPVGTLAIVGTVIATALMGGAAYFLFDALGVPIPLLWCMIFGALIAPTDPVAVLGIMRSAGAPKAIETKVIGESLFNDGIGVVVFAVLVGIAAADTTHGGHGVGGVVSLLAQEVIGGIGLGLIAGYACYRALRTLDEPNLEILISIALVMVVNFVAFKLHTSSPLACVVAGLLIGNRGRYFAMSERTRSHLDIVWSFIDEALNAILFLIIGLEVVAMRFEGPLLIGALIAIPLALSVRAIAVFIPMSALSALGVRFGQGTKRVLTWGGLKGGISIALAMSLPDFEGRDAILTATYAVVVFSILVQGLTVGKLIRKIVPESDRAPDGAHAH